MAKRKRTRFKEKEQPSMFERVGAALLKMGDLVIENKEALIFGALGGVTLYKGWEALKERDKTILEQIRDNVDKERHNHEIIIWIESHIIGEVAGLLPTVDIVMGWINDRLEWKSDSTRDCAYSFTQVLKRGGGDCDDLASFFCTVMEARGFPTSTLFFPGTGEAQGHVVGLVRLGLATSQNKRLYQKHGVQALEASENKTSYLWLICDPQLGAPNLLGSEWQAKLRNNDCILNHHKR